MIVKQGLSRYRRLSSLQNSPDDSGADNPTLWLLIFSDLTTLLLTFFVLRLALLIPFNKVENISWTGAAEPHTAAGTTTPLPLPGDSPVRSSVISPNLAARIRALGFEIQPVSDDQLQVMLSEELFQEGSAELSFDYATSLAIFVRELRSSLLYQGLQLQGVEVRGHSDSNVINSARYPSNWELSTARAARVARQLDDSGVSEQMITAAGYGDSRPISRNQIQLNKHLNRRTELLIKLSGNVGKFRVSENLHLTAANEMNQG